ncbi:ATP-binding protein [Flavobacterium jejuense]|uniref:ATP-binding protein n=1 Tax=Flavobacterium jejuense TaxID=1544455 RepID=A0ABX0IMS4_9FLAO|nr:ATP-binding protein [Flavobacterium jejuense]NHN24079.1 ATP-binding protein [Flavobacterium jejuense]
MDVVVLNKVIEQNAVVVTRELEWLNLVIETQLALHFHQETPYQSIAELPVPNIAHEEGYYAEFLQKNQLNPAERLVLILALVPHIKPAVLDILMTKNTHYDRRYSEFGGLFLEGHSGLIPTAETALFILAGDDLGKRLSYHYIFSPNHILTSSQIIKGVGQKKGMPRLSGTWLVANEYVEPLISGEPYHPSYSEDFPAQLITTNMEWDDIIVSKKTAESLLEIQQWVEYGDILMHDLGLSKLLKPGYKSLFYGPPGTGKTMTAALLGKSTNRPVYKLDLSMVVSKYIGETEKNLAKVFDQAEKYNWILFFDEADSLFGKRTQVTSANDRYGNQEIGYLLQRIEDFPGVVILASNLKENIDDAFTRRFQSMVAFRMPNAEERFQLWQQSFSAKLPLDPAIDLRDIAEKYALAGGVMINVVRKATLRAVTQQQQTISQKELETAIQQELQKEGIILNG